MKLYRLFIPIAAIILAVLLFGTQGFAAGKQITIKGSTTVLPIAQAAAEVFMEKNPAARISVQGGGSGVGITSLIEKTCDIADSSRKIKDEEIAKAKTGGVIANEIPIAMDGIAMIVHPSNKLSALTRRQIQDIYTGKVSDWSELGVGKGKIVVLSRDTSSGTYESFENLAINKEKVRPDALINASNQAIASTVANTPGAIGYIGHGYLSKKVKAVTVDGIACTRENILSGKYPLSRALYMYTNAKPTGDVKAFIDFVLGPQGKQLIEEEGFVGLK
ncbi:MAG: phosphate ABC transporter substrate-binding protein [Syntrophaceae bacterium]